MNNTGFQSLLQRFFLERLMKQRNVSPCTVSAYRDTFKIFLKFMQQEKQCNPLKITIEMVNAKNIVDFLNYIEKVRNNSIKTRNSRLATMRSFMKYVSFQAPEYLSVAHQVMSIPFKKTDTMNVNYLVKEEVDAIIKQCSPDCWLGRRDRIMILILYNTGLRVSELVSIQIKDIYLGQNGPASIRVLGKGRKERTIPIWNTTQKYLSAFLKELVGNEGYLFTSQTGKNLTRAGVRYRLDCLVEATSDECPSLIRKHITPHVFRHTTAMHLLQAGVDISTIAIWLGHESIETTHKYMVADLGLKEKALAQTKEPAITEYRYKPSSDILSFLDTL